MVVIFLLAAILLVSLLATEGGRLFLVMIAKVAGGVAVMAACGAVLFVLLLNVMH